MEELVTRLALGGPLVVAGLAVLYWVVRSARKATEWRRK